ncbi:MAG: hypothetical protein QXI84_09115 [Thermofilaceae archaeon]
MAVGKRARRGQFRIIELIVAVTMVVTVMLLVAFFTRPIRSPYLREVGDLRRLAYNLLNNFAEAGVFERVLNRTLTGGEGWEGALRMLVASSVPPGIVFKMEIYRASILEDGRVRLERLDSGTIANVDPGVELREGEAVHYTLVCTQDPDRVRGEILYIVLVIGYAG